MQNGCETISVVKAGERLGISRCTAFKLAREGHLGPVPVLRVGKRLFVSRRALDRVLNAESETAA